MGTAQGPKACFLSACLVNKHLSTPCHGAKRWAKTGTPQQRCQNDCTKTPACLNNGLNEQACEQINFWRDTNERENKCRCSRGNSCALKNDSLRRRRARLQACGPNQRQEMWSGEKTKESGGGVSGRGQRRGSAIRHPQPMSRMCWLDSRHLSLHPFFSKAECTPAWY